MIIATAGHVDHGKTALVKALTGVDTDRLPEEKARGMSIELGFAYRQAPDGSMIGMVDVPGHERFVHTMVAGVAGIHHALLVVAADDGPMPQTREHIAILAAMGVKSATLAVTKIDVEGARVEDVQAESRALLEAAGIETLEAFPVCALRGEGIAELQVHLDELARRWLPPPAGGVLRFAVDRSFTLEGVGVVVTGMMAAGSVSVGDSVASCTTSLRARVRSLRAHNRAAQTATAGERCALNLTGPDVNAQAFSRGDWIVAEDACHPTRRIDALLRSCAGEQAVRQSARVHVHLGAKEATGRLLWLSEPASAARDGWAQIQLDEAIGALWGERILVRDWSASATLAGGRVVDPFPVKRERAERIAALDAMAEWDAAKSLGRLLQIDRSGVDLERFARSRNLQREESEALFSSVPMSQVAGKGARLGFEASRWNAVRDAIVRGIEEHHQKNTETWGPEEEALRRGFPSAEHTLFASCLQALIEEAAVARMGSRLHCPGWRPQLSPRQRSLWERIEPILIAGGLRPPSIGPLANEVGSTPTELSRFLAELAKRGYLLKVADNRFFLPRTVLELARAARNLSEQGEKGRFSAADFRDATGIGRNLSIEVLEYFDRCRLTRRTGERRMVVKPPEQLFG